MLAMSIQTLVFYPFIAVALIAGGWLLISSLRKAAGSRLETRAGRLASTGQFDQLATLATDDHSRQIVTRLLVDAGQPDQAVALLVDAGQYVDGAKVASLSGNHKLAGQLFQRGGDFSAAGACYLASGDFDDAVRSLRQVDELLTAARFLDQRRLPGKALPIYLEIGDHKRAAALAAQLPLERQQLKGIAHQFEEAEQYALAVPLYLKGHFFLDAGRTLERMGRSEEAIKVYLKQNYFVEAANLHARAGRHREAAELFLKGGVIERAVDEMLVAGEFLAVARLYRRTGKPARALDVLEKVAMESEDFRAAQLLAASIEEENHRFEHSASRLQALFAATGYSAQDLEVLYRLVDLLIQIGKKDEAIATLEQAKRSGVADPGLDEQLIRLREAPEGLFEPEPLNDATVPAHRRARFRGDTTTVGFPRSDRYILKRKLARGGHGILFLVEDTQLQRNVVLKLLHSESLPSDLARRYFLREARTAASLAHANIVRVFDYGEIEGRPYLAMEYVDGLNLLELQESLPDGIPFPRSLTICAQLCDALEYAHQQTIIHRDIKMENVMVTSRWQTKLMDFGLAKALNENPDRSLFIIGTPFYMSPEQIVGDTLDNRTDVYSVGILMYRLFTGRLPFEEGEVLSHHRFTPPPDPREFQPQLPRLLAETILQCIKKERDERFDAVRLVGQRLRELMPDIG